MALRLPLADIQFISDFATYARTKGEGAYKYTSSTNCALSQFLRETGRAVSPSCTSTGWWDLEEPGCVRHILPDGVDNPGALFGGDGRSVLRDHPDLTFSALADRLEALIADAPVVSTQP